MQLHVLQHSDLMREDRGWTRGYATCSFDDVPRTAPGWLDYGSLRLAVLQEVDVGAGYPMHRHQDVETITIMLAGAFTHEDTVTGSGVTAAGEVAVLSAGTGIEHSEHVRGDTPARAVMFWLRSSPAGAPPRFAQRMFDRAERRNRLVALASGRGHAGALKVRDDAVVLAASLEPGFEVEHALEAGRRVYLLAPDGALEVDGGHVAAGERVLASGPGALRIRALSPTDVFVVDLAA